MMNFASWIISFMLRKVLLTCHKILQHGANGFTSPPKEGMLWTFIAHKNLSPSVGIEPTNLGSNGKNPLEH
jgi:hypothetical protein